ncbi:MAG TPA: hypothetical protein VHW45_00700 [Candidatus Sulfotelmatobacter sp.]|nr:hypothetical protein [Candidatus Sulfotelmatobacter sp.]
MPKQIINLANGYTRHMARMYGDDAPDSGDGKGCENCGSTQGYIDSTWTDDGTKPRLCQECAGEIRRLEKLADRLADAPSCQRRQEILDASEPTAVLVNRLRAHDMEQCAACAALCARVAPASESESNPATNANGKVA